MDITVVGTGYVGIVTAACLAARGHEVVCVDVDQQRVRAVNDAVAPIHEVGLQELLEATVGRKLSATTDLAGAVARSDLTFVTVATPFDGTTIDLKAIKEAARQIGEALRAQRSYHTVVVKSTVVPGTTDEVVRPILEACSGKQAGTEFGLGVNPEFLTEGTAVSDFMAPDRIVIGGIDDRTKNCINEIFAGWRGVPRVLTNNKTAEMIKYASNVLLATMISFSNEIANLCSALGGIDAVEVMRGVHLSRYLSDISQGPDRRPVPIASFLHPGCGFGGSCLPKDTQALIAQATRAGRSMPLLEAVLQVNDARTDEILALVKKQLPTLEAKRVTILGLAFKPDTDDVRDSPAIPIVRRLIEAGAKVKIHDPVVSASAATELFNGSVTWSADLADAVSDVDAVLLTTSWEQFRDVPKLLGELDPPPLFVDGRRMLDKDAFARYEGIGL